MRTHDGNRQGQAGVNAIIAGPQGLAHSAQVRPKVTVPMSIIPAEQKRTGSAAPGGLMALVHSWLANLPPDEDQNAHRRAVLRRELDAFAWNLIGRMDGIAPPDDGRIPEIPLDMDKPNR